MFGYRESRMPGNPWLLVHGVSGAMVTVRPGGVVPGGGYFCELGKWVLSQNQITKYS